jgi:hypothetical protein
MMQTFLSSSCHFSVGCPFPTSGLSVSPYHLQSVASSVAGPVHPSIPYFYVVFICCVVLVPMHNIAEILLAGQ